MPENIVGITNLSGLGWTVRLNNGDIVDCVGMIATEEDDPEPVVIRANGQLDIQTSYAELIPPPDPPPPLPTPPLFLIRRIDYFAGQIASGLAANSVFEDQMTALRRQYGQNSNQVVADIVYELASALEAKAGTV